MITQGVVEQSPLVSGQYRTNMAGSVRILETNSESIYVVDANKVPLKLLS